MRPCIALVTTALSLSAFASDPFRDNLATEAKAIEVPTQCLDAKASSPDFSDCYFQVLDAVNILEVTSGRCDHGNKTEAIRETCKQITRKLAVLAPIKQHMISENNIVIDELITPEELANGLDIERQLAESIENEAKNR